MTHSAHLELRWASADDDADIRALVGSVAMPGAVAIRFAREPDYFLGTTIMGDPCDVLVARERPDGPLVGMACRAERAVFLDGVEARVGYIGQIRVAPKHQGAWLVHRGARLFREASPPGMSYFGVIASDNPRARALLVGSRPPAGIRAARVSGLTVCAILLRRERSRCSPGLDVGPASADLLPDVVAFLRAEGPERHLFPAYTLEDFTGGGALRGLGREDVMVARRDGRIVGVMAVWDQSAYKQDVVAAYGPALRRSRPFYDLAARVLGASPLTRVGDEIPLAFAACTRVAGDDPATADALLSACARHARERGKAYLMVGLADSDPLLPVVSRRLHITYRSDLYALSWDAEPIVPSDRVPYIEIATL